MKRIVAIILGIGFWIGCYAQQTPICISTEVTTTLVFESEVRHVDLGGPQLIAQQVKEAPSVVLLKGTQKDFTPTNVSVITADGRVYAFAVAYDPAPKQWVYEVPLPSGRSLKSVAQTILGKEGKVRGAKSRAWGITGQVKGIYSNEGHLFFHLGFQNKTALPFAIDFIRFWVRDAVTPKRTAAQEVELLPVCTVGATTLIPALGRSEAVWVLKQFSLPEAKYLHVEVGEKDGGRQLSLRVNERMIVKAAVLPVMD